MASDDVFTRVEDTAPNLGAIEYIDDPEYICCAEVPNVKREPCLHSVPDQPIYQCLNKEKFFRPKGFPVKVGNEHDILFRSVKWRCKAKKMRHVRQPEPSLGAPVGLSASTSSMNFLQTKPADISLQGFATVLVAYAEYFITPEVEWNANVLNRILVEGQRLFTESKTSIPSGGELKESSMKRTFMLCGNAFNIMIVDPFLIGRVVGDAFPMPGLYWGLEKFFKKFQFCLLQIGSWYVLVWKNTGVFFVFDCFGRRVEDLHSDRKHGIAVLICLRSLENVSHLLINLSGVKPDQLFTIRQLQLKSLTPCGGKPSPEIVDRTNQYEVMHSDYAVLRASIHLGSRCFKEIRYRHSLSVAIAALINAKIDPTPTWDRGVLDKVLKIGAHLYKQWTQCDVSLELGIQDVPSQFVFGQFTIKIAVNAIADGLWKCTPNYVHSELSEALARAFGRGGNLILHTQGRSYAIWKKGTFYYLSDPYSHQCSLGKEKLRTASVRMCGGFARMCCVVTQSLLDLFEESKFIIYLVKITHLEELSTIERNKRMAATPCMCLATPLTDAALEVTSINESVIGPDGYECAEEPPSVVDDSADLNSPGLSQTRLDDCTDMRRELVEDSESEEEDDEDLNVDVDDAENDERADRSEGSDIDDIAKEKPKKAKKNKEVSRKDFEKEGKAGGDASDGDDRRDLKENDKGGEGEEDEERSIQQPTQDKIAEEDMAKELPADVPVNIPVEEDKNESEPGDTPQDQDTTSGSSQPKSTEQPQEQPRTSTKDTRRETNQKRRQPRKDRDESSSDETPHCRMPPGCLPNAYPGFTEDPQDLAVVGSESGSYESLCSLLKSAFRCADRVLTMTPWGNYVAFRANQTFFIYDGCTCNLRSIRHLDLSVGTAGLLCFSNMHGLINYIESGKNAPKPSKSKNRDLVDQICKEFCGR